MAVDGYNRSSIDQCPQPQYTQDWTSGITPVWLDLFTEQGFVGKPDLHFLEIGAFEGRTTRWLLEHVLTDETSGITVVDTFKGSPEHAKTGITDLLARFWDNVNIRASDGFFRVSVNTSFDFLIARHSLYSEPHHFDFIYVDGSHRAWDVLTDGVLAWPLLKPCGIMIFDDYNWIWTDPTTGEKIEPKRGIDAWLHAFAGQYELIMNGSQIGVRKPG